MPKGWRQFRNIDPTATSSTELFSRIREHNGNIDKVEGISSDDFSCRFVIFEAEGADMISTIEAALIKLNKPLWNSALDGFGNHTPGKGRFNQAKSDWDVIHPGREWADKCTGQPREKSEILTRISEYFSGFGDKQ